MNFLRTLFWVVVAVAVYGFSRSNWHDVTINLWSDIQADIKLPILLVGIFLAGFLPTFFVLRARVWTLKRRVENQERQRMATDVTAPPSPAEEEPAR